MLTDLRGLTVLGVMSMLLKSGAQGIEVRLNINHRVPVTCGSGLFSLGV